MDDKQERECMGTFISEDGQKEKNVVAGVQRWVAG